MAAQQKKRANGGGRNPNSEPKIQVFKGFAGCNFELSPRNQSFANFIDQGWNDREQTDLPMNYFVMQNNVIIDSNGGLCSRNDIEIRNILHDLSAVDYQPGSSEWKKIYSDDADWDTSDPDNPVYSPYQRLASSTAGYTGVSCMLGKYLYLALSDGNIIRHNVLSGNKTGAKLLTIEYAGEWTPVWSCITHGDGRLIAIDGKNDKVYVSDVSSTFQFDSIKAGTYIDDPSSPPNVGFTGISSSDTWQDDGSLPNRVMFAYSYVTDFGPTKVSPTKVKYTNVPYAEWNAAQYAKISGVAPAGVNAVEVYYSVGYSNELLFANRYDFINTTTKNTNWTVSEFGNLTDTSMVTIANLIAPTRNYTTGPDCKHCKMIDGRMYFWGSKEYPYRLYIGGNPGNILSVSSGTGGGFVDIDPGSGTEIRFVDKYKTQSGNSIVTALCDSENSTKEQRYNIIENTVSLSNDQSMKGYGFEQVQGAVGTKSYHGAVVCEDGLYCISRYGMALTTMTMEYNSQIKTMYISDPIKPVFTSRIGERLSNSMMICSDGIIYFSLGTNSSEDDPELDRIIFCYDVNKKAWWTYDYSGIVDNSSILSLFHYDYERDNEGIGIITKDNVMLIPTVIDNEYDDVSASPVLIETGELSTTLPLQSFHRLSQLEFHFDRFSGDLDVEVTCIDQFGRKIVTRKSISSGPKVLIDLVEHMRIDMTVQSYKIRITGRANFRMTHFLSKVYTLSNKIGMSYGFNDSQTYRTNGDIHPTFKDYDDVREEIIS